MQLSMAQAPGGGLGEDAGVPGLQQQQQDDDASSSSSVSTAVSSLPGTSPQATAITSAASSRTSSSSSSTGPASSSSLPMRLTISTFNGAPSLTHSLVPPPSVPQEG